MKIIASAKNVFENSLLDAPGYRQNLYQKIRFLPNQRFFLDDVNEKELNNRKVQAFLKCSSRNKFSVLDISQDSVELPEATFRAIAKIAHV